MSAGILATVALGTLALAFVLVPLFRRDAAESERLAAAASERQELSSRKEMLLGALKDLEDDRATDKIDEGDYEQLHARLTEQAVAVMQRLDGLEGRAGDRGRA